MRKKIDTLILILILSVALSKGVLAGEPSDVIHNQLELLELDVVDRQTEDVLQGREDMEGISFGGLMQKFLKGELSLELSDVLGALSGKVFGEIRIQFSLVKKMLVIVILSGILKNLNTSFQGKSVGELGFYICYMVMIVLITATFYRQTAMVSDTIQQMTTSFQAMLPVFFALSVSSGNYAQTAIMGPTVIGGAGLLCHFICIAVLPAITLVASLEMVNNITEKPMLDKFTELFKCGLSWGMKGVAMIFMTLLSLQRLGSSTLKQAVGKTAKAAVGAIPVVGDIMGGAVDAAAALTGLFRNGAMAAAALFLILLCAIPLLKLGVMILIYKLTAAVAEPVCEGRLVKCISAAGDFSVLLFGALFLTEVMFVFSVFVILAIF